MRVYDEESYAFSYEDSYKFSDEDSYAFSDEDSYELFATSLLRRWF